ncbi:MAG: alpha/beta fold hydrolase [Cellvibrionaceae bacterium]
MSQPTIYKSVQGEQQVKAKYAEWLKHWPVEKQLMAIPTHFGKTCIIASGHPDNPPVFLFHGAGTNSIMWLKDIATLTKNHRVYAVDILGQPGHSEQNQLDLKSPDYANWIKEILETLNIKHAIFIGMSLGGWMCLKFACTWPEKVTKLALLSPAGITNPRKRFIAKAIGTGMLGSTGRKILFNNIIKNDHIEKRMAEYLHLSLRHFTFKMKPIPTFKKNQLSQLYCPVFLILGGKDAIFNPNKILIRLAKYTPQVEVIFREESGHMLGEYTRDLDRFLLTEYAPD